MKIVIISLEPKQAKFIADEFPRLDLAIITKDNERQAIATAKRADVVVVMTRFISHALFGSLDRSKMYMCNGGMTELRRHLTGLQAAYAPQTETPPPPRPTEETAPVAKKPTSHDYTPLRTAKVADVFVYPRPSHRTLLQFETDVNSVRSYYKRQYGVISEQHTTDSGIEIIVTKAAALDTKCARRKLTDGVALPPPTPVSTPAIERVTEARTPIASDSITRMFWRDVYLEIMRTQPGASHNACVQRANDACASYSTRFKEPS